jgi:hypothetical protein
MRFLGFENKSARWIVKVSRWDYDYRLKHLEEPTMKEIRILRFFEKIALMPAGRLTWEVLGSYGICRRQT